jgi:hypothetical protein
MRGHKDSKSNTYTEDTEVYAVGISVMECAHDTRGDLDVCRWLPTSRDVGMDVQKSAEAIVSTKVTKGRTLDFGESLEFRV